MIKDNTTIDVSKHTLTLENRLLYAKDMASTTPSPGRGAMFAGIYSKNTDNCKTYLQSAV